MDSVKILLFSDDEKLYNSTERIIGKKHQLKWCTYQQLENNRYPTADVVIFHFTKEIIERERAFAAIIKIKGSLGHLTPIPVSYTHLNILECWRYEKTWN